MRRFAPDSDPASFAATLEEDGAAIIEDFVGPELLARLWSDFTPALEAEEFCDDWYNGTRTRRISSLFHRSHALTPVVLQPLFIHSARELVQRPVPVWVGRSRVELSPTVQISGTQLIQIHPGQGKQPLHRDDALHLTRHPGRTTRVQLMLALSEFSAANGGTQIIPGSHHWDDERAPQASETIPTELAPGSAAVWLGGVYHGGGRNDTATPRTGMTIALDAGNLRQEENQYLAVPRESVLAYPEEVRRLLGYDRCPPGLGWLEMQDPYGVLDGTYREVGGQPPLREAG